jgi:hypothetical protein
MMILFSILIFFCLLQLTLQAQNTTTPQAIVDTCHAFLRSHLLEGVRVIIASAL